ncbi:ABC transporter permease [Phytoactinopolyspora halotolerans]|uniref:ABC transporter permease n=1 Tax=Phytoactinopolyspora halotolerans TaxID=1981512 RepID=A0A6L9SHE2_9ACTN|nr:ABC transporter permease [Phytoactinopolyspora halotolerans]NEE04048.1 ABC transporter permease [Phytoactinopolyspora halotolerans]
MTERFGPEPTDGGAGVTVAVYGPNADQEVTVRAATLRGDAWQDLRRNPLFWISGFLVLLMIVLAAIPDLFAGWFGNGDPRVCDLGRSNESPTAGHPFGFDKQGCDVYANVIHGARASISVGVLVTVLSLLIAVVLGAAAGYRGKWVDALISRVTDIFFGFPFILGALVILVSMNVRNIWTVSLVLALFGWPTMTRVMRSSVLSVKQMDYVVAARGLGADGWWLVRKHILPNAIAPVMVMATIAIGTAIVAEAVLTFLGVGLQAPAISWGLQLSNAQNDFQIASHLLIYPSIFLSVTVLSFIVLGDVIRDAFDPRLR